MAPKTTYEAQRPRVTPPHVALADLRHAAGLTLDAVCERVAEQGRKDSNGRDLTLTRGGLSAIENGHRGASAQLLMALAVAFGLREDALSTSYVPRPRAVSEQVPA